MLDILHFKITRFKIESYYWVILFSSILRRLLIKYLQSVWTIYRNCRTNIILTQLRSKRNIDVSIQLIQFSASLHLIVSPKTNTNSLSTSIKTIGSPRTIDHATTYVENNDRYRVVATLICLILGRKERNGWKKKKGKNGEWLFKSFCTEANSVTDNQVRITNRLLIFSSLLKAVINSCIGTSVVIEWTVKNSD